MVATPTVPVKPTAIVEIERLGFTWAEDPNFALGRLDVNRRVQVREAQHYAPRESVERYAVQMGETAFPPIVVTKDNWIVDGNTRVGARIKRKEKFTHAIVLDVERGDGSGRQGAELHALAATLNAANGVPLTAKETRDVAVKFIELGWKTEQISRAIGLSVSAVAAVRKEIDARAKLARVGLDENAVRGASLRALGTRDTVGMNDVPFQHLARLSADAGLNAGEIAALAKKARESGSDSAAIAAIEEMRMESAERIRQRALTGVGKPPISRQLRQHLGYVTKFVGREADLLETNRDYLDTYVTAVTDAIGVLNEVLRLAKVA